MSLYECLGVNKSASDEEIHKAYKKLSLIHHPDKGGDPEKFKEINHAREVLGNPDRRSHYDMTGSDDESGGGMGAGGINLAEMFGGGMPFGFGGGGGGGLGGIFGEMFGGGGGRRQRQKAQRGPDKSHDIPLSLADFYKGREIQIKFHQQRGCGLCKASGALKSESCSGCKGQGMKVILRQLGPGMIQQMVQPCNDCNGEGKRVTQVCHECNAKKYKVQEKVLNAKIVPGMTDGEKLRFPGECSDSADYEHPGDVILNLMRTESLDYEWQGSDLHINHSVSLKESLLGFNVKLDNHPSGKEISMTWGGGTLKHDGVLVAKGLGMPVRGSSGEFGDLFIHVDVMGKISEWTDEQRGLLQKVFPDWTTPEVGVPLSGV